MTNIFPCCISHFYHLLALRPLWSLLGYYDRLLPYFYQCDIYVIEVSLDVDGDGCSPLGDGEHS